jgi:hypothetical protein
MLKDDRSPTIGEDPIVTHRHDIGTAHEVEQLELALEPLDSLGTDVLERVLNLDGDLMVSADDLTSPNIGSAPHPEEVDKFVSAQRLDARGDPELGLRVEEVK